MLAPLLRAGHVTPATHSHTNRFPPKRESDGTEEAGQAISIFPFCNATRTPRNFPLPILLLPLLSQT